jgi:hypothetical protein
MQIAAVDKHGEGSDPNRRGPNGGKIADIIWTRPDNRPVDFDDPQRHFHDNYDLGALTEWFKDVPW